MHKNLSILGSTGSIGQSTLQVVRHLKDRFSVRALAAHRNIAALEAQAHEFHPQLIAVYDPEKAEELQRKLPATKILSGREGLEEAAALNGVDTVVSALSGAIGIYPTLAAIEAQKTVALANKEVLVMAGEYVMARAAERGVKLLPIDSEHSALFQCLEGRDPAHVRRLILTASGGPFWRYTAEECAAVTLAQALQHPTWNMGPKVTIDSSTLMNKGLEVIEAHFLFQIPVEKIEVVIHPQSVVHSMVELCDGSVLAQLSEPNMMLPIQYALTYPDRAPGILPPLDFERFSRWEFFPVPVGRFACLELAFEALRRQGNAACYLNAANEVLVDRFLKGEIGWTQISEKLERLFRRCPEGPSSQLQSILATDAVAREHALKE